MATIPRIKLLFRSLALLIFYQLLFVMLHHEQPQTQQEIEGSDSPQINRPIGNMVASSSNEDILVKKSPNTKYLLTQPKRRRRSPRLLRQRLKAKQKQKHYLNTGVCYKMENAMSQEDGDTLFATRTASSLWRRHAESILRASLHPLDLNHTHVQWTRQLFHTLTPHILQKAIRSSPHNPSWGLLLRKISRRYHHPSRNDTANIARRTPPIQVAVFGGSVTLGRDCHKMPTAIHPYLPPLRVAYRANTLLNDQSCSWVFRLQHLIDSFLGTNIVQIHNLAAGGTDSQCALPLLQYQIYNQNAHPLLVEHGPDVIINAYSANDNSVEFCDPLHSTCLTNHSRSLTQAFTTTALSSGHSCQGRRPVVLYLDDYVGKFWDAIPAELQRHVVVQEEHAYSAMVGHVSSMSAWSHLFDWSRHPTNRMLSPFKHPAHFGLPGHVARMWMVAYALLQWTVDYCQDSSSTKSQPDDPPGRSSFPTSKMSRGLQPNVSNNPPVRPTVTVAAAASDDFISAPLLQPHLRLENITFEWNRSFQQHRNAKHLLCTKSMVETTPFSNQTRQRFQPCSFAFVAGPSGTHVLPYHLRQYLYRYVDRASRGWDVETDYQHGNVNNLGWVVRDAKLNQAIIRVTQLKSPIQVITIHYLKSYGEKWINSLAHFSLYIHQQNGIGSVVAVRKESSLPTKPKLIASWQLSGYHNHKTSVSHVYRMDIGTEHAAQIGDVVELHLRLLNGTNFKIQSLLMCSR